MSLEHIMSLEQLVARLRELGVHLSKVNDRLHIKAPPGGLTDDLSEGIRHYKEDLLSLLPQGAALPATASFGGPNGADLTRAGTAPPLTASTIQERLWFLHRLAGGNAYNITLMITVNGPLDRERLAGAFLQLVERHEPLRTVFEELDGECRPHLLPSERLAFRIMHVTEAELPAQARTVADEPFGLIDELPIRVTLFVLSPERSTLTVCFHHLAVDGWSLVILLDELKRLIAGETLPPLAINYAKWVHAEREDLQKPEFTARLRWWADYLEGLPRLWLAQEQVADEAANERAARHVSCTLSPSLLQQLIECAGRLQTTLFALSAAAFGALLAYYSRQPEVAIGTPVSNRGRPGTEQLVGLLANTLVLRCSVEGDPSFARLVRRLTADVFEAMARPDVPLDRIVSELHLPRRSDENPLFQVMLVMQPAPMFELPGALCQVELCPPSTAKFDLTLTLLHSAHKLVVNLEYRAGLISDRLAQDFIDRFVLILREALRDTSLRLSELPTLAEIGRNSMGNGSPARAIQHLGQGCVDELLASCESATGKFTAEDDAAGACPTGRLAELEQQIGEVWRGLLGLERVRPGDDFFELGGHSLLAMRLVARLSRQLGIALPVSAVFEAPRLRDLTARVAAATPCLINEKAIRPSIDPEVPHALSFAQERLWVLEQIDKPGASYNMGMALRLSGSLDLNSLALAFTDVLSRHRILGVRFHATSEGPHQFTLCESPPQLEVSHVAPEDVERLVADTLWSPFEINDSPLVRLRLLIHAPDEQVLAVCLHHAVCDGWSVPIFINDISTAYAARVRGIAPTWPDLPIQYADFAVWQRREMVSDASYANSLAYWKRQLAELPVSCTLPLDLKQPEKLSHRGKRVTFDLVPETAANIRRLARMNGASPFMILLGAFAIVVSRFRGDSEVVVGSPFAGRTRPELEQLIGCFVNTLVLRIRVNTKASFAALISEVKATVLAAQAHQAVPFERVVEALNPSRSPGHSQLFQILFAMDTPDWQPLDLAGLQARPLPSDPPAAKYDLNIHFIEHTAGAIKGYVEYAVELFERQTIERLIESLQWVLSQATARPERPTAELSILTPRNQQELARSVKPRNASGLPTEGLIHEQFAAQAQLTPLALALEQGEETWTYEALARKVNQLAHHFKSLGAGPDIPVAVFMGRSIRRATVLLSILTAGAAYIPLGFDFPVERKRQILRQTQSPLLVVDDPGHAAALDFPGRVVDLKAAWAEIETLPCHRPPVEVTPDRLAYVMFTSGTMGEPKGVMVTHRGVAHDLRFLSEHLPLVSGHRVLQVTEYTFDPSVRDLFAPLGCGATAVLLKADEARNPDAILRGLASGRITHVLSLTPTMLRAACTAATTIAQPTALQVLMLNGEPLTASDIRLAHERLGDSLRVFNQYGPTEATMTSCIHEVCDRDLERQRIPVGPPNPNTQIQVLDEGLRPVPIGVFGEVFIGGIGIARGYLGNPQLTEQHFIRRLGGAAGNALWYHTGDIGRWLPDGTLDLCGRRDTQVKVRGNRVELAEIEECLRTHPHVHEAAVAVHHDSQGVEHLVAYIVFAGNSQAETGSVRGHLSQFLPAFVVPSLYVTLDHLPYMSNGKLDRRRLPEPRADLLLRSRRSDSLPMTQTEQAVAALWQQVLPCFSEVDRHANFFDVGGNSLLLIQLHQLMNSSFEREDPIVELFRHPTIAAYAAFLDGRTSAPVIRSRDAERIAKRRRLRSADPSHST